MDVTFFEHQSYFPKPAIQGENSREFQLWDILRDTQSVYISPQSVNPTSLPSSESSNPSEPSNPSLRSTSGSLSESQFHEPSNIPNHTNDLTESTQPQLGTNCQELRVYSRRRRPNEHLENITQVRDCQELEPDPTASKSHKGTDSATREPPVPFIDDSDLPIAKRKGVRACTNHPIGKYVAYGKLQPAYRAFISALDSAQIPNSIQEALKDPAWKQAVEEEIRALKGNET